MHIKSININNFRNHSNTQIEFGDGVNVISGQNGSGKTTILEAVSVASLSKTFQPCLDISLIKSGEEYFSIKTSAISNVDAPYNVQIEYRKNQRKKINTSIGDNLNPKDIIGIIPLVVLSPDFKSLTFGSPQDRRQFLDMILSQSGRHYASETLRYRKLLKQRNSMLSEYLKSGSTNRDYYEILTDMLIKSAVEIYFKRLNFVSEFKNFFETSYKFVSNNIEVPEIIYMPDTIKNDEIKDKDSIKELLQRRYSDLSSSEFRRGSTLFGPHKDDIIFKINGLNSREAASQGQHKSLLISIKLAEFEYLKDILNETPVILFDDVFSELDTQRSNAVFSKIMENKAQTLITLTNAERFSDLNNISTVYYEVQNGIVRRHNVNK
ncbi:MAG: DNA replication and repair protein RecF [Candidatus Kapabacteria bacterium]|nr:DNA replication and repair protein RecF [Ignavibacteriota bacterium]MCW5885804.1 DNA replication and repair protein RecF [Candidatus Kapabacteria bacterium]